MEIVSLEDTVTSRSGYNGRNKTELHNYNTHWHTGDIKWTRICFNCTSYVIQSKHYCSNYISYLSFALCSAIRLLHSLRHFINRLLLFVCRAFHLRFVIQDVICAESRENYRSSLVFKER